MIDFFEEVEPRIRQAIGNGATGGGTGSGREAGGIEHYLDDKRDQPAYVKFVAGESWGSNLGSPTGSPTLVGLARDLGEVLRLDS